MNVVIKAGTDKSFLINDVPYQKGAYEIVVESNNGFISILRAGAGTIITKTALENVRGGSGQSFATFEDFVNYIEPFFFRSIAGGGGGGDVTSVFGRVGIITAQNGDYNAGQITETATKKIMTDAERTKLANQSGTNTGDETTASIQAKRPLKTVGGTSLEGAGDVPFPTAPVTSVFSRTGIVTAQNGDYTTGQITEVANKKYVTDAQLVVIGNTSNTNTGDETTLSIQTKRPLKTVNGNSLEGTGNVSIPAFNANTEKVLTKYKSATRNVLESTSSTAGVTYLTLIENAGNFPIGQRLRLSVSCRFFCVKDNESMFLRILDYAVQLQNDFRTEASDTNNKDGRTFVIEFEAQVANSYQISLVFGKISGGTLANMESAIIEVQQIPS